ncbi:general secretion pathway protein [Flavobacterium litorale]|uniref:General secretion pathway protein n=1 Tax=Flavobacterium litorale TaxID=2856519 RepID=A0ABX8V603_9FLAO|nr:general secretion pathway protein [Flavobacterium litorale]QYJ68268.1 general secretion pathway protein [Flavobacterium litorale]
MKLNRNNKLLLLGLVVTLYICYVFAFANTIKYYKAYNDKNTLVQSAINNPNIVKKLVIKEKQLDTILKQYSIIEKESFQNELLKKITVLSNRNDLKITDFKEPHSITENGVKTSSYIFTLQGSYNGMLLLINAIENDVTLGAIKHVAFQKKKNYKYNTNYLTGQIIMQKNETVKEGTD